MNITPAWCKRHCQLSPFQETLDIEKTNKTTEAPEAAPVVKLSEKNPSSHFGNR